MIRTIEDLQNLQREFLTVRDVAEFLGVNRKTVYKYIGSLPFRVEKVGRKLLIPKHAFLEYVLRSR